MSWVHIWLQLTSIFAKCQFHFWLTFLKLSFILCVQCLRLGLRKLNKEEKNTKFPTICWSCIFCLFLWFYRSFFIFYKDANLENVCTSTKITNQTMQTSSGMLFWLVAILSDFQLLNCFTHDPNFSFRLNFKRSQVTFIRLFCYMLRTIYICTMQTK